MKSRLVALCAMSALLLAGCGDGTSATGSVGAPTSIKFVITGPNSLLAPLFLGIERGEFEKAGLNVSYQILPETNIAAALSSGDAQLTNSMPTTLNLTAQGKEVQYVYAGIGGGAGLFAAVAPNETSLADCKEMVNMVKGGSMYGAGVILKKVYGASYEILDKYNIASLVTAAALKGEGDCMTGSYPNMSPVINAGKMKLIVDPRDKASLPAGFPTQMTEAAIVGLKKTLEEDAMTKAMPKFLKVWQAMAKDIEGMSAAQVVAELRKNPDFTAQPAADQERDFDILRGFISPGDGYISPESWTQTMQFFIDGGIISGSVDDSIWSYKKRVNMSFYEEGIGKPAA